MPYQERFKATVVVHLLLVRGEEILLSLRHNTGYGDGLYSVVSGTLDGGETAREATAREAREEAGIELAAEDLAFVGSMHCSSETGGDGEFVEFFFRADRWRGEVQNTEPHRCLELKFYPRTALPPNMVSYVRRALECMPHGIFYEEFGWEKTCPKS